jgi:hypothetical protein
MLSVQKGERVYFCGGKDYLPLFCQMTEASNGERIVFFNSKNAPRFKNIEFRRFPTRAQTQFAAALAGMPRVAPERPDRPQLYS